MCARGSAGQVGRVASEMRAPWGSLQELGFGKPQTRAYKAAWVREKKRRDPEFAERDRERIRLYRKTTGRQRFARYKRNWIAQNREKHLLYFRERWHNKRRCFSCRTYRKGRRMKTIERLALVNGKWQKVKVLWCGNC
jgi:hypothetical protein